MLKHLRHYKADEDGAVTVDWVVLTAAITGLAFSAWTSTRDGTLALANKTQAGISNTVVK
ncbi:hypothetical protein [Roseovarius sp. EL26]|uniref:hypothetical protein n=1 Tax=Roseovarius sp. EL26 TaxID=2126672 RepID=UPI000EA21EBE|nr:hypothetical protein [Roseovarius sp. EL26]